MVPFAPLVDLQVLPQLLRISGAIPLYTIAKDATGRPDPKWKIIWIAIDRRKHAAITSTIPGFAGLVRTDADQGIRVDVHNFEKAWLQLKPNAPVPDVSTKQHLWKVSPFPLGVTKEVLLLWGNALDWSLKPIKSLKKHQWLIASDEPPPKSVLSFNGTPLILQKVDQRPHRAQFPLAAGPMPKVDSQSRGKKMDDMPAAGRPVSVFRQGDPFFDPWAAKANSSDASSLHSSTTTASNAMPADGPFRKQLDAQDAKIIALEKQVHEMSIKASDEHATTHKRLDELEGGLQQHTTQTKQAFAEFQSSLQQSLAQTMASQMQATMASQEDRIAATMSKAISEMQKMCSMQNKKRVATTDQADLADAVDEEM